MSDLILIEKTNLPQLFAANGCDPLLDKIRKEVASHNPDIDTSGGRKDIASLAYKIRKSKTVIDDAGKNFVSKIKEQTKTVDAERKRVRDELDQMADLVRTPLTEWEAVEEVKKQADILARQLALDHDDALAQNDIFDRRKEVERKEADLAKKEQELIAKEEAKKAEEARIEREQAEKVAREQREKQIEIDAISKAQREAEKELQLQKEKAEKILREEQAKTAKAEYEKAEAIRSEREKAAREALEKEEEKLRIDQEKKRVEEENKRKVERVSQNKNHQKRINNEILDCFAANGISEKEAKTIVVLVASGKINHMTINY